MIGSTSAVIMLLVGMAAGEKTERFDTDPGWSGPNHRSTAFAPRVLRQDFGFSETRNAGGRAKGELGGLITPAGEHSFYAKEISHRSFDDRLQASGTFAVGEGAAHALIGFFNSATLNEWRTPNSIALRIQGRGDIFYAYLEYATSLWRAGADGPVPFARVRDEKTGREAPRGFSARGAPHRWSLDYDPKGNGGMGVITATIDDETSICNLDAGHKADGASFDRFGLLGVLKSADSPGELWIDDVTVLGETEWFDRDPGWDARRNRVEFETTNIRPRFNFGFSPTNFAGGNASGEFGGQVFRGDCREASRLAACGDLIGPLRLNKPFRAHGKLALTRAVSDSTTLFGFYHSEKSLRVNASQSSGWPEGFVGFAVEGPSREGFFVYPCYRTIGDHQGNAVGPDLPRILPDGKSTALASSQPGSTETGSRFISTI
jgi:hypothetical protein